MASQITMGTLLGFKHFFPNETPKTKEVYANQLGKELLFKTSCHFLSYFRLNAIPPNEQLIQEWFTFYEIKYYQVTFYHYVISQYNKISDKGRIKYLKILAVEIFLKLFVWLNEQSQVPNV